MRRKNRQRKSLARSLFVFIILCLIIAGGLFFWWHYETSPANPAAQKKHTFIINDGESVRTIADQLQQEGYIKNAFIFFLLLKQTGLDGKIQAGIFQLSPAMSAEQIAQALQVGTFTTAITIPEGKRAEEIADILQAKLPDYQNSWRQKLDAYEGYLFPDTYAFDKSTTIDQIIRTMTENFNRKYASIIDGRKTSLSKQQIVTIASIIEREARFPQDRPLVASVILNRLRIGMPLQIDATVQYALGYQPQEKSWWKKDLTTDDLQFGSPYNTYLNTGLPPTPISNPGLESLQAVIDAPETDYLYYISDKSGHNHFEATLEQQNADMQKYGL